MSETMGRCRSEVDDCYGGLPLVAIADAIDRLAEDVAAIKAKVDAVSPDDVRHFVESEKAWVTPPWQRAKWDEALAIICNGGDWGRGNNFDHGVLGALVIWADKEMDRLTAERDAAIRDRDEARAEVERLKAELAARRSMAPVVEVPAMPLEVGDANTHTGQYLRGRRDIAVSYRAALDKAGVAWKEVGRE